MRFWRIFLASLGIAWCASTSVLAAPAEDPEALIKTGNELRRRGDDVRAEGYFQRAYQLAHTPRSEAQLGLVELALGRFKIAEDHLSEALAADDAWVQGHKAALGASRAKARAKLLGVELIGAPRDATVVSADGTVTKVPPDSVLWLEPGDVKLTVQAVGHKPASLALSGGAGEKRKVDVAMPPIVEPKAEPAALPPAPPPALVPATPPPAELAVQTPPESPTPAPPPAAELDGGRSKRIAGIVVGGVGVAVAVSGVFLLEKGNSKVDATNTAGAKGGVYNPANGDYQTFQGVGVGLIAGGAAAVAAGGLLYALGLGHGEAPAVSLNVSSGHGLMQWTGAF
jgi:hypothetical protein